MDSAAGGSVVPSSGTALGRDTFRPCAVGSARRRFHKPVESEGIVDKNVGSRFGRPVHDPGWMASFLGLFASPLMVAPPRGWIRSCSSPGRATSGDVGSIAV